ncbi:MAG: hypothetical protein HOG03_24330 [Desulfobacula sp.]|uniref:hypothetical protein n=1 Tax=Desulfobacula sp. TaxID=2593537 RepID=UPI001EC7110C|nr:hypothetical protein [Desulfobacula sp.]
MSNHCTKVKHNTTGRAKFVAKKNSERYGVPFTHYLCKKCHKWHTGRLCKGAIMEARNKFLEENPAVVGIDPGIKGALALICGQHLEIHDYKSTMASFNLLNLLNEKFSIKFAIIEKVWIWKNEKDVKKAETLIRNQERWKTLLRINTIDFESYAPVNWRKNLIYKKDRNKPGYIRTANRIFSGHEELFTRHDRAEAALIAYRAWRHVEAGMATSMGGLI